MKILVLGAGMQGRACSYDLLKNPALSELILVDANEKALAATKKYLASKKVRAVRADLTDAAKVKKLADGCDVVVSCVPYFLNLALCKAALAAKAHWVDLGGNTDIVMKELALSKQAEKAGVTILPDVGLGPGMITTFAVHAMGMLDTVDEVLIRDGGLPQRPVPPMNYMLTFSEHGLINEYVEDATALRDFKVVKVPGLSEVETIDIPGLGRMEAAHASGGLSTLAFTYEGKVRTMHNKLIRYPGHCAVINAMTAMGFFSEKKRKLAKSDVSPREMSAALFREHFSRPGDEDFVVIHSTIKGTKGGRKAEVTVHMLAKYDRATKMTAMMQTTGFPASIVAQMLASGEISKRGAFPVETGIPTEPFIRHMKERGYDVSFTLTYNDARQPVAA